MDEGFGIKEIINILKTLNKNSYEKIFYRRSTGLGKYGQRGTEL
jgi:hypothetical protein